jgi:hypothetical protein
MNPIEKLVELLKSEEQSPITILPNGEIRKPGEHLPSEVNPGMTPLTFRENLGGEYAFA